MKLDGAYSHLTFIATQTDGIQISEIMDTLDPDGAIKETLNGEVAIDADIVKETREKDDLGQEGDRLEAARESLRAEVKAWKDLQTQLRNGYAVFAPAARLIYVPSRNPTKRRRIGRPREAEPAPEDEEVDRVSLTAAEIEAKLNQLDIAVEANSVAIAAVVKEEEAIGFRIELLQRQKAGVAMERARMCMQVRNDYCRVSIAMPVKFKHVLLTMLSASYPTGLRQWNPGDRPRG